METATDRTKDVQDSSHRMTEDIESIKTGFAQLRRDVMDLLGSALGLGRHGAEAARDNAAGAVDALKSRLADLKDRGADGVSAVEKKIEDNPLPAALIAFGVGFVLAKFLSRR